MPITLQNLSCNFAGFSQTQKSSTAQTKQNLSKSNQTRTMGRECLVDKNHNQILLRKNSNINFKGGPAVFSFPLNKKIASILPKFEHEHVILIGKDIKEAQKLLEESVTSFPQVIKKVFFIQENTMKGAVAIKQNGKGLNEIVNLNKEPVKVEDVTGKKYFAKKGENIFVRDDDDIFVGPVKFNVAPEYNTDLSMIRDLSVKEFDFSNKSGAVISKINKQNIETLIPAATTKRNKKVKFSDIGGQDEAIARIKKAVVYKLKYPKAYENSIVNRGVILEGGPGTGKTLLAQSLANETDAHYIELNGLEMESKWVGESEKNWRNLFAEAKEHEPTIIFIDEFDAVAKKRAGTDTSRYDDKVVNQLLTLMSDAEKGKFGNVFVVVATNKKDLLDDAIIRSGRFGTHIGMGNPDLKGCKQILDIYAKGKPISESFNPDKFAKQLHDADASGADIADIVSKAYTEHGYERAGITAKMDEGSFEDKDLENFKIEPEDFEKALDELKKQKKPSRRPIGYTSSLYKDDDKVA